MKNLILILVLLISFTLSAQDKVELSKTDTNDQANEWMTKISSDSEMRSKMMDMMIAKTEGNEEEMIKLINPMLTNPGMHKMIFEINSAKTQNGNISMEPRGMMNDSIKMGKVYTINPIPKK